MAITYPSIPLPLVSGYKSSENVRISHDNIKKGISSFGLITNDKYTDYNVSWLMSDSELQTFESWYATDLVFGSKEFEVLLKMGNGLRTQKCYFSKPPKSSLNGKKWNVTAKLIGVDKPYDSLSDYLAAKNFLETGQFNFDALLSTRSFAMNTVDLDVLVNASTGLSTPSFAVSGVDIDVTAVTAVSADLSTALFSINGIDIDVSVSQNADLSTALFQTTPNDIDASVASGFSADLSSPSFAMVTEDLDAGNPSSGNDFTTWSALPYGFGAGNPFSPTAYLIFAIHTDGAGEWMGGDQLGYASASIDNAVSWSDVSPQNLNSGGSFSLIYDYATDGAGTWLHSGASGYGSYSIDNRATWNVIVKGFNSGDTAAAVRRITHCGGDVYVTAHDGGFAGRTTDKGVTWNSTDPATAAGWAIGAADQVYDHGVLIRVGNLNLAARSVDQGATWSQLIFPSSFNAKSIASTGVLNEFVAVSRDGRFSKSTDAGLTWSTPVAVSTATDLLMIRVAPNGNMIAISDVDNKVFKSLDGGTVWTDITGILPATFSDPNGMDIGQDGVVVITSSTTYIIKSPA